MSFVSCRWHAAAGFGLILLLAGATPDCAQAQTATSNTVIPAPRPSIFPQPTATSQTCNFACSSQLQICQNSCIANVATGTTIIPSLSSAGVTSNPNTCQSNCSAQLTACQRNCNLGP